MTDNNKIKEPSIDYVKHAVIPDGKIADYITGQWIKESEQEKVRQNFERTLSEEYNYLYGMEAAKEQKRSLWQ